MFQRNKKIVILIICLFLVFLMKTNYAAAAPLTIKDGREVTLNYTLTIDGQVIQATEKTKPLTFIHGERQIVSGLAKELLGMKKGQKKTVTIAPKDGYGDVKADAFREVAKENLVVKEGSELKQGMVVQLITPDQKRVPGIVWELRETTAVLNFNHPLAGKTLVFDIEVLDVKEGAKKN